MIDKYLKGTMPGADRAIALADALGVSVRWLISGDGPRVTQLIDADDVDWVMLPSYDLSDFTPEGKPGPRETVPLRKDWLSRNARYTSGLWLTEMPPSHHADVPEEGDTILCRDATERTDAGTYLYFFDGVPIVRRWTDPHATWEAEEERLNEGVAEDQRPRMLVDPPGMRIVARILGSIKLRPL